jgi:hypothetical protein
VGILKMSDTQLQDAELERLYAEVSTWPTPAIGRLIYELRPAVESGEASEATETALALLAVVLSDRKNRLEGSHVLANDDYENRSHGTAEYSPTSMLKRGQMRVEVPAGRIDGQHRVVIEKARGWLEAELNLPFLMVSYYTLQERTWDRRDDVAEYQADLSEHLETCNVYGYVEWSSPMTLNIRADQTLPELLEVLAHEARHSWQASTSLGAMVGADRREPDARLWVDRTMPRLLEYLRQSTPKGDLRPMAMRWH